MQIEHWPTKEERLAKLEYADFVTRRVTPCAPARTAGAMVLVDGRPYAGFGSAADANAAVRAWRERWPAAAGRTLEVVVRGGQYVAPPEAVN